MQIEPLEQPDLIHLKEFEPPDWGDLVPRFKYCIESSFCHPVKMKVGNKTIAIGTTILHRDSAWLASIIVHPDHRNKGFGKAITRQLIDSINTNIHSTISLDATDLGFPVYNKLGFKLETIYAHLKSESNITGLQLSKKIVPFEQKYLQQMLDLDVKISAEYRQDTVCEHLDKCKLYVNRDRVEGFYLATLGNGLIVAENDTAGSELIKFRLENNYYAILPSENTTAIELLVNNNLRQFRISRRMFIGKKREWRSDGIYNRISGQLG
ncbi:MAG: GNAT family N-acetyltransferase [Ferruginibacter sp.]